MAYFPMFIDIKGQSCLIVGGGRVALRKVRVLQDFGARVTVAAPDILAEIEGAEGVICLRREYDENLLAGMGLVVAATDDAEKNRMISRHCMERKIPVNAVDQIEDCSFIFPSYVRRGELVAAFSSGGKSPLMTQYLKAKIEPEMTEFTAELTDYLGSIRDEVKAQVETEALRKKVYQQILAFAMEHGKMPEDHQLAEMIKTVSVQRFN